MSKAQSQQSQSIRRTGWKLAAATGGMFLFGYALVPLYDVICQVTGLNGKTSRAEATVSAPVDTTRWVTVEFLGNTTSGLPWEFRPLQKSMRVHPGEVAVAQYEARNIASEAITGQAVPSLAPSRAASHFKKIECFCFTQQKLAAGESRRMPVRFYVDPSLDRDVTTVTLSYAFFNADKVSAQKFGGSSSVTAAPAHSHEHHAEPAQSGG
jgi:cytochrome c oxidase assembly protein subunit 11